MRPLKLTMSAFGPYAGEEVIEMKNLGKTGLYLITGDTGSGKTTIFDAICFALYGAASGENRENSMLRSVNAVPGMPTKVELSFEHRDREYVVTRNPDYMRPKGRGTGETLEKANAVLKKWDGQVVEGVTKVNAEIRQLLGVEKEEFTQIAMLAQGQFLKLLFADTKDKKEIFGKIFHTEKYGELQTALKKESTELKKSYETAIAGMKQYIAGVSCAEDDELSDEVDKAKSGEAASDDVNELISRLVKRDTEEQKKTDNSIKELEKKLADVNAGIGRYKTVEEAKLNLQKILAEREKLIPEGKTADDEFESAQKNLVKREELQRQMLNIEAELPSYDKLDELNSRLKVSEKQIDENSISAGKQQQSRDVADLELSNKKKELEELQISGEKREQLKGEIREFESKLETIESLKNDLNEINKKKAESEEAKKKFLDDEGKYLEKKKIYDDIYLRYLRGQAGILAQGLKEGEVCPVCGSTAHPNPAKLSKDIPTKEMVDDAKAVCEKANERMGASSAKAKSLNSVVEELTAKLISASKAVSQTSDVGKLSTEFENRMNEINAEKNKLNEQLKVENEKIKRKAELESQIPDKEKKLNDIRNEIERLGQETSRIKGQQQADEKQRNELLAKLSFPEKKSALQKRDDLKQEIDRIQREYESAELKKNNLAAKIKTLEGQIEGYEKITVQDDEINIEELKAEKERLESEKNRQSEVQRELHTRITANKKVQENMNKKSGELTELEKKYSMVSILANTVDGSLNGKEKIQLETYVQMAYLDRIIRRANIRFLQMSDGQYEMERQNTADNKARQSGLDLVVVDHYHPDSIRRSVKSLSGGEAFMASLSLALGLSEEVQASAGGIQIDTLFVDEGFGSLDTDKTLPQAYSALAGLTNGNKLVGIISHVAELKDWIGNQIVVEKDRSGGSTTKLITL
jgi:exonuclease SbcC